MTVVFGCVVILIATLTAADYLTREVEEGAAQNRRGASASPKNTVEALAKVTPKSAEELGLVANYDEAEGGDGSRYV